MVYEPTIILAHGFWGGAAHWVKVISEPHRRGCESLQAVELALASLKDDAERTRKIARSTGRCGDQSNVTELVFVAGWAPDAGESQAMLGVEG
jgi:hypothetical protein